MSNVYGIHFGLNNIGFPLPRPVQKLRYAENDAEAYDRICKNLGWESKPFLRDKATLTNFNDSLIKLSKNCVQDDLVILTFSGHGSRVKDINLDEDDKYDEILAFYDKLLLDDLIKVQFSRFREGVNIFYITDCCYSGTVSKVLELKDENTLQSNDRDYIERGFDFEIAQGVFDSSPEYKLIKQSINDAATCVSCSIIHIAACQDDETAWDGNVIMEHGLLTDRLLKSWQEGAFKGNYQDFFNRIKDQMEGNQNPNLSFEGKINTVFNNSRPFHKITP